MSVPGQSRIQYLESSIEPNPAYQALHEALGSLSEPNRQLSCTSPGRSKPRPSSPKHLGLVPKPSANANGQSSRNCGRGLRFK